MLVQLVLSPSKTHLGKNIYPVGALTTLTDGSITKDKADKRILTILCSYQSSKGYRLNGTIAFELLEKMLATKRVFWAGNQRKALVQKKSLKVIPGWKAGESGELFKPCYDYPERMQLVPCSPPMGVNVEKAQIHVLDVGLSAEAGAAWQSRKPMNVAACQIFTSRLLEQFPECTFPVPPSLALCVLDEEQPKPIISIQSKLRSRSSVLITLMIKVEFDYRGKRVSVDDEHERVRHVADETLYDIKRQKDIEAKYIQSLEEWGLKKFDKLSFDMFDREMERHCYEPDPGKKRHWQLVLDELFPLLSTYGWVIEKRMPRTLHSVQDAEWYTTVEDRNKSWFTFETGVLVDGEKVNLLPIVHGVLRQYRSKEPAAIEELLKNTSLPVPVRGRILLISGQRLLGIIRHLFELYSDDCLLKDGTLKLSEFRVAEIHDILDEQPELDARIQRLREAFQVGVSIKPARSPKDMLAVLRPYQKLGLAWLEFLQKYNVGGILADDMGLGKTVQTLALLLKARKSKKLKEPALIVAPTSVLPNWRHEIERFTPLLSCAVHHGADRHAQKDETLKHDIILTTYALLRNDVEWLSEQHFSWIILDEAQNIKNARSQTVRALSHLKGTNRLCLTGTPMENHLGELWSLFNFIMPGFLGGLAYFKRTFQVPIERDGHALLQDSLKRRMRPFILRRTKALVETELPDKVEMIETISLSEVQRDLYESVRLAMTGRIQKEMATKGFGRSKIVILDALLKLRQICCDPRLRGQKIKNLDASCKMAWLKGQVPEMIENGRRILLFSQFTSMLELIEKWLKKEKIQYVQLTGSTRDRDKPVQQFQAGDVPVFLISLKAGGTGLNLTAADTVIHYDPWWNPAAENQATDRAHRIGQDKHVFVYKLITEFTVEEHILGLQKRKAALADAILEKSSSQTGLSFSEEDLEELLAPLPE